MKILRIVSTVVVILGILVWFFAPFVSAITFQASDGIPASSLVFYSNSAYSSWNGTLLYWLPIVSLLLLGVCLLFVLLNDYRFVGIASLAAIVTLASGSRLIQVVLKTVSVKALGDSAGLSVGLFLLIGVFGILLGLSVISLCKVKDVLHAISALFVIVGGVVWFTAPFLSYNTFQGAKAISSFSLVFVNGLDAFPSLTETWFTTPLYWIPLVSIFLFGVCLLFILAKNFHWVSVCSLIALVALISGGVIVSKAMPLKPIDMHLGIGFYLLIGLFAAITCFCVVDFIQKREVTKTT